MAYFLFDGYAIITGGAGGIGQEVGFTLAEVGLNGVLFADIDAQRAAESAEKSKKLAKNPSYRALSTRVDVADSASVQAMVEYATSEFGRIDYLVNAAGVDVAAYVPLHETPEDDFDRVMDISTKGIFLVSKAVIPIMLKQEPRIANMGRHGDRDVGRGVIINIASVLALLATSGKVAYVASKHAALGITRASAYELQKEGIRVNIICPSWVQTPMFEEETRRMPPVADIVKNVFRSGRPVQPDEVAAAVQYLCSPSALYISGTQLTIDSGLLSGPIMF